MWPILTSSYPESQFHSLKCQQPKLKYNRRVNRTIQGSLLERPAQAIRETAPPGHIGHLLYKAIQLRLADVADLLNTKKPTQKNSQNEKKKCVPNEKKGVIPEKRLNEIEASELPETEFKTLAIRMLN